ncbi:ribosome biogenesis protein SLX9-domain-containing protein [Phlebopus sp. FC_14]|nr:ribosome biogenesis protein SLX9-domain-containing protein [Phlebopus sp. FC_14]
MPRERRARARVHEPSVKLPKRKFALEDNAVETVKVGAAADASGQEILQSLDGKSLVGTKKEKSQLKREAFLDRLKSSTTPYSKTQRLRFNRHRREQVGGGLGEIEAAISTLDGTGSSPEPTKVKSVDQQPASVQKRPGMIGKSKSDPLTKSQRKRTLEMERLRHPLILSNPHFATNPFQTIRVHAQNTLEKHAPST